ncbi:PadR family transcriptional regulator [Candidatus Micrarchaeota archaeon]|nr:PadR family transcriptional regulator [Candidatus Micrarchaeota archaeon]
MNILPPAQKNRKAFERMAMRHMFSAFLLWYISKGRVHGYELIKRLEKEEGFRVTTPSQLYPMLKSLMKQGFVSQEREMRGKRARKVYRITAKGRVLLQDVKKCMRKNPLKLEFLREMVA